MKVIDLLNNIADEKFRPLKIEFDGKIYELSCGVYYDEDGEELLKGYKLNYYVLNKGIEIIEEDKKIEKLKKDRKIGGCVDGKHFYEELYDIEDIGNKINEIIDEINKLKENK